MPTSKKNPRRKSFKEKVFGPKKIHPLGLDRIYFDTKNKIQSLEVLRETSDGTIVCWDPDAEVPIPFKRADYQREAGGFWGSESEAAKSAVSRMQIFIKELDAEIELFSKLI